MRISNHIFALFLGAVLSLTSCSSDDDAVQNTFSENINTERFTGLELGNSDFILPQTNIDIHVEFDYLSPKSKVSKIFFDVQPKEVLQPKQGEVAWKLENYLVPVERYQGKLNPHLHYHVYFDPENKYEPSIKPAQGVYDFKITVHHEDGTISKITKAMQILQKFEDLEIATNKNMKFGQTLLPTKYRYNSGDNTVEQIKYELWFKEWRDGQNVAIGKWDKIEKILPQDLYKDKISPSIIYDLALPEQMPVAQYWLNIYVKEAAEKEAVKLSIAFTIE